MVEAAGALGREEGLAEHDRVLAPDPALGVRGRPDVEGTRQAPGERTGRDAQGKARRLVGARERGKGAAREKGAHVEPERASAREAAPAKTDLRGAFGDHELLGEEGPVGQGPLPAYPGRVVKRDRLHVRMQHVALRRGIAARGEREAPRRRLGDDLDIFEEHAALARR